MKSGVASLEREPVQASQEEEVAVERLHEALERSPARRSAYLIAPDGEELEVPRSVYGVLVRVVHELAQGHAVAVMPVHAQLTTQQAADLLGVSRPHLIKLLEEKRIPYNRPGKHRRILLNDLLEYKRARDAERRAALDALQAEDDRLGLRYA